MLLLRGIRRSEGHESHQHPRLRPVPLVGAIENRVPDCALTKVERPIRKIFGRLHCPDHHQGYPWSVGRVGFQPVSDLAGYVDVSQILREQLFEAFDTVVLTSATLTVAGRFEFIRQRMGVYHAKECQLPPEFDYEQQALLYLPQRMPDVRDAGFSAKAADEIVSLLELSQGRAFCLFTSYAQMNDLFERVRDRVDFPRKIEAQLRNKVHW